MTADIELLPCPFCGEEMLREFNGALFVHPDPDSSECPIRFQEGYTDEDATAWNRRANVVHATAAKDAEIERLRAEVAEWKRVAAAQAELHGEAEARAERLAEALRGMTDKWDRIGDEHGVRQFTGNDHKLFANELRAALRDHDQEGKDG